MAIVDVIYYLPIGGHMAQLASWLGPIKLVGGRLALLCIHQVNRVNSRNESGIMTAP